MSFWSKKSYHLKKTIAERIDEKWPLNPSKKGSAFQIGYIVFVIVLFLPLALFAWFVIYPIFGPICNEYTRHCSFNMVVGSLLFIISLVAWMWFIASKRF